MIINTQTDYVVLLLSIHGCVPYLAHLGRTTLEQVRFYSSRLSHEWSPGLEWVVRGNQIRAAYPTKIEDYLA